MWVPHTSSATGRPGSQALDELSGLLDVGGLAAVVPVARDLVGQVPGEHARVQPRLQHVERARGAPPGGAARACATSMRPGRRPGRRPARRGSRRRRDGRAARARAGAAPRVAFAPRACRRRDDRVHVAGQQRVAAAGRVLLQRRSAQTQRPAVEQQAAAAPAQLAQPDARVVGGLAPDGEAQRGERGLARRPQLGPPHERRGPYGGLRPAAEVDRGEAQRLGAQRAASRAACGRRDGS